MDEKNILESNAGSSRGWWYDQWMLDHAKAHRYSEVDQIYSSPGATQERKKRSGRRGTTAMNEKKSRSFTNSSKSFNGHYTINLRRT